MRTEREIGNDLAVMLSTIIDQCHRRNPDYALRQSMSTAGGVLAEWEVSHHSAPADAGTVLAELDRRGEIRVIGFYCEQLKYISGKPVHPDVTCCKAVFYRPADGTTEDGS